MKTSGSGEATYRPTTNSSSDGAYVVIVVADCGLLTAQQLTIQPLRLVCQHGGMWLDVSCMCFLG